MSNTTGTGQDGPPPPTHIVVASGRYGTVNWTVCKELWDILPTAKRERALDASARIIDPFFVKLVENLLARIDLQTEVAALVADWSFEEIEQGCTYGAVVWQVSQGTRQHALGKAMTETVQGALHGGVLDIPGWGRAKILLDGTPADED